METYWYLSDYCDEVMPCAPTPEAWAKWLSEGDGQFGHDTPAEDGATFDAYAMDVRAHEMRRGDDGLWKLPPDIKPGFTMMAICQWGDGWDAEDVVEDESGLIEALSTEWFDQTKQINIAVGYEHAERYVATYSAEGPKLTFTSIGKVN